MAELAGKRAETFPVSRERVNRTFLVFLGVAVVFCGCMAYLEISPSDAVKGFPAFARFFAVKFLPASFKNIRAYVPAVVDTVLYAVVATYLSTALSFLFGLLMSEKNEPYYAAAPALQRDYFFFEKCPGSGLGFYSGLYVRSG